MQTVKIVPPVGDQDLSNGVGTKVLMPDGTEVPAVTAITIRLAPNQVRMAELSIAVAFTEVDAHVLLDLETVRESAAVHGYDLVKREAAFLGDGRVRNLA